MSDGLKVDFAEIDRMVTGLTTLNAYALPLVPKVGALSADGDLLASAILSPGTAVAAEGAVLSASAQLGVTMVTTEALVVITASIVKVYEAAETAIAAAAAAIEAKVAEAVVFTARVATDVALGVQTVVYTLTAVTAIVKQAIDTGLVSDIAGIAGQSMQQALSTALQSDGTLAQRLVVFASAASNNFGDNFMAALPALSPKIVEVEQNALGDLRGSDTYENLLSTLIADGHRFGLFEDGDPYFVTDVLGSDERKKRAQDTLSDSETALGRHLKIDDEGNVIPTDVASLFASSSQIDGIGQDDFANIRIIKTIDDDKVTRYTVQIPSTQSWERVAGVTPNDLTSDVMAMRYGNNTALSNAVMAAMRREGITDEPVMLVGFSLGGITAGAIAADPHGYNIQQVVTAGAPVGAMNIPAATNVTSFESVSDPVAALDGVPNPDRSSWDTVRGDAPAKPGETGMPSVKDAHDADRYAVMATQNPAVNASSDIAQFLGGDDKESSVNDWEVRRTQ
ncbi:MULTISPECIES: hypothetical protein [unclassified Curtobacterium]|uniref:hypothetical protein n=1 Tax=unclassified Curtobacterium TaxID=257496 RepID=UPI00226B41A9|nr:MULTISPECIES: hypothetical protein [unclassified Curtobacterium]